MDSPRNGTTGRMVVEGILEDSAGGGATGGGSGPEQWDLIFHLMPWKPRGAGGVAKAPLRVLIPVSVGTLRARMAKLPGGAAVRLVVTSLEPPGEMPWWLGRGVLPVRNLPDRQVDPVLREWRPPLRMLVRLAHLGLLRPDSRFTEDLVSEEVRIPMLGDLELRFVCERLSEDSRPAEFADAIANLLRLTAADRDAAAPLLFENYQRFAEAVGEEQVGVTIRSPAEVWQHVQPGHVHVSRHPREDRKVYVRIAGNCAWEIEHGIQLVYREGRTLVRVSGQDGHLT